MRLTRERKEELVDEMAEKLDEYPVVGILDMHSLPAKQLQEIKKELVGEAEIQMSRKTLIQLALEASGKDDIEELADNDAIMPALIFTEKNPFSLYKLIQNKKSSAAASGGEIAPNDIVIEEGDTGLDPGPMLGQIQSLGAQTEVQEGTIAVTSSAVAVEAGEEIDRETAEILNNLGMEPLEVGLDLKLVYEDGEVFDKDVLAIDAEDYRQDIEAAASGAFNLAVNAGVLTARTAPHVIRNAVGDARNLAVNAGVIMPETIDNLLSKGVSGARALDQALDLDAVDVEEDAGGEERGDDGAEEEEADGDEEAAEPDAESDADAGASDDEAEDEGAEEDGEEAEDNDNDVTDDQTEEDKDEGGES